MMVQPIGSAGLTAAVQAVDALLGTSPSPGQMTVDQLTTLQTTVLTAQAAAQTAVETLGANIDALAQPSLYASGTAVAAFLASFTAMQAQINALAYAADCAARMGQLLVFIAASTQGQ